MTNSLTVCRSATNAVKFAATHRPWVEGKVVNILAVNSKRKGKEGELSLAKVLRSYGYDVRRSVQYNGKAEDGQADLLGLPNIHIECKRTESLRLYDAVDQAKRDSAGSGEIPAVFHRKNNCEWVVILPLDDFMTIYREYEAGLTTNEKEQEQ